MLQKSYAFIIALLVIVVNSSVWTLREGQQALVIQFGEIKGDPIVEPGMKFKIPFVQDVRKFEKRILIWDGDVEHVTTKDKKFIVVDSTARWQIENLHLFVERVMNEDVAQSRLDDILDGATRDVISSHNLIEAVRNSNTILTIAEEKYNKQLKADSLGEEAVTNPATIEKVFKGREKLSQIIIEKAIPEVKKLGIKLIDMQLRRIAYERSVEAKVYDRMISERQKIAAHIMSIGKGEEARIKGRLNKDLKLIESKAYRESQAILGEAESKAIKIYAAALNKSPDFYKFREYLETYKLTINSSTNLILSSGSPFLKYMLGD